MNKRRLVKEDGRKIFKYVGAPVRLDSCSENLNSGEHSRASQHLLDQTDVPVVEQRVFKGF